MYKKIILATAIMAATQSQAELMMTTIVDGPLVNGTKAIEFYTSEAIADLSEYRIANYANGNTEASNSFTFPNQSMAAGSYFWITNNESNFIAYFGFAADATSDAINGNGDDVYSLTKADATIDTYGVIGIDGTGQAWEYLDGWAHRNHITAPNFGSFDPTKWTFSGIDALDSTTTNGTIPVKGVVPDSGTEPEPDTDVGPSTPDIGQCGEPATLISAIQGNGATSPRVGEEVVVEAIVHFDAQGDDTSSQYSGFFLQEETADSDNDSNTSEGMFVYHKSHAVNRGDLIRVVGKVAEYNGFTRLNNIQALTVCSTGNALPAATELTFPVDSLDTLEALEGMRVTVASPMVVSDFYGTGYSFINYGQFVASTKLHYQPTATAKPSVEGYNAAVKARVLDSILIDDGVSASNPDFIPFPNEQGFSNTNYFRVGFEISNLSGVIHGYDNGNTALPYSLIPSTPPTFTTVTKYDRTLKPYIDGSENLVIASMNVLNLFNGVDTYLYPINVDDVNDILGDYRGAQSPDDYDIQLSKIVQALSAMDADVIGLMEIENDGFGSLSSIKALVDALNSEVAESDAYDFVNAGSPIGDDAIAVGLLYRKNSVTPVGTTVILDSKNSPLDENNEPLFLDSKNRPSLIQSFKHIQSEENFTVSVNHLKSKGSSCSSLSDPNLNDGAGNCNLTRTKAAKALAIFLNTKPTGIDTNNIIIMGDLNSYAKEDPIAELETAGFVNLKNTDKSTEEKPFSYSYSGFLGSLDYIIGSESMTNHLLSIDAWHINSLESDVFDYDTELDEYDDNDHYANADDPYYSSDHDPIVAAFFFKPKENEDKAKDSGGSLGICVFFMTLIAIFTRRKINVKA